MERREKWSTTFSCHQQTGHRWLSAPLAECVGQPVGPEAAANRDGCCIGVPGVVWIFGHDPGGLAGLFRRRWLGCDRRLLVENSTDRCLSDVNAGSGERFRDLYFAQRWAEPFDLLNCMANEVGEPIDGRCHLKQRVVIGTPEPGPDRIIRDEEATSRFRLTPTSHRTQFHDRHPFDR